MKLNQKASLIFCIFLSSQAALAMHETESMNELSSLEHAAPFKNPSRRYFPQTPSPLAHSISAHELREENPSEPTSAIEESVFRPEPKTQIQRGSDKYSPRTRSPLSNSTSASELSDIPYTNVTETGIRSAGLKIYMSVNNRFNRILTLQTTHLPTDPDPFLLPLTFEHEIQPGFHEVSGLFSHKKYGYGKDEVNHKLTSIKFLDPENNYTLLKEIKDNEFANYTKTFFGILLQPNFTLSQKPPRAETRTRKGFHSPRQSRSTTPTISSSVVTPSPTPLSSDDSVTELLQLPTDK